MKKLMILCMCALFCVSTMFSQTITLDTSSLSPELKAKIVQEQELLNVKKNIQAASEWAGMGKEIGEAVNGALGAIADNVDKVGNTNVGKFTMFLVAYKVLGEQIFGFIFIPIAMLLWFVLFIWLVKKFCLPYKYKSKDALKEKGKVIQPAEYTLVTPSEDAADTAKILLTLAFVIVELILIAIMFN